jgi:glycosyltransferase involved in cell wall biosynthesis
MADAPLVSVVIPTRQRREALRRALTSLALQTVSSDSYEVIVSIDGSTDNTREMLEAFAAPYRLRVADGRRHGRAAACNAGLELARGEVVIVLDDDMEVVPEFIERHRRHHPPGSRLCVLGAVPVQLREDSPRAARYVATKFSAHLANIARPGHVFMPRDFYSGNASLRANVLREVGSFDNSFAVYGNEDVELSLRLRAAGVSVCYDGEALARQEYAKDLRALARDTRAKGASVVMLARRHPQDFAALRLSQPHDGSRPWLAARAALLRLTRRRHGMAAGVFELARALERLGLWRQPLFYRALLDYAFWVGVDAALRDSADASGLSKLRAEINRGPIDLLLHR